MASTGFKRHWTVAISAYLTNYKRLYNLRRAFLEHAARTKVALSIEIYRLMLF